MGIRVEFNPDLALRDISEFHKGNRKVEECIPEDIKVGKIYEFLKREQRLYRIHGEIPLIQTQGGEVLSRPKASVIIQEVTHFLDDGEVWTRGKYKVIDVFDDDDMHFECFDRVGTRN